jgi:hypothetical protein
MLRSRNASLIAPVSLRRRRAASLASSRRELNVRRGLLVSRADLAHLILAISGDPRYLPHGDLHRQG